MQKAKKVDVVISILNNVLESLFTKKEIEECFNGDIVESNGFGFSNSNPRVFFYLEGNNFCDEKYNANTYYNRLVIKKENPIKVLNEFQWDFDEEKINKKKVQTAYHQTLKYFHLE